MLPLATQAQTVTLEDDLLLRILSMMDDHYPAEEVASPASVPQAHEKALLARAFEKMGSHRERAFIRKLVQALGEA